MTNITIQQNADGTGTVTMTGVPITPYIAPIDPPSATSPPTATLMGMTMTADKDVSALKVGDTFTVSAVLNYSDGSSKPVSANAFSGFDKTIIASPNSWTGTFTADAAGSTTITNSNSGVFAKLKVTVLAADTSVPPPVAPPPTEPPPDGSSSAPDPTVAVRAFAGAELHWRDTDATDVVDVSIQLDPTTTQVTWDAKGNRQSVSVPIPADQQALALANAPVGVTPLNFADGSAHLDLVVARYKDCVVIENPWPDTSLNYSGTLTVRVNGAQVFQQTGVQFWVRSRTAPIRVGLPQYTPKAPDLSVLPNYGNPGPLKAPTPGGQSTAGTIPRMDINGLGYAAYCAMGSTGGRRDIAIIPGWDLPFALQGTCWQECRDANDHSAVWPIHVRDPHTGMVLDPVKWADASLLEQYIRSPNFMAGHSNPIDAMSTCPYTPNTAHQTHFAIVPYLATGSDFDLEEMLAWACYDAIEGNPVYRQFDRCIAAGSTRAKAWILTQWSFTAKLLPESHPYKPVYAQVMHNNAAYWWGQRYAPGMPNHNPFGMAIDIAYMDAQKRYRGISPWQNHYLAPALGLAVQHGFDDFKDWRDFCAGFAVNSMAQMCYQMGTFYNMFVVDPAKYKNPPDASQLWDTWDQIKADTLATAYGGKVADQAGVPCGQMKINVFAVGQMSGATGGTQSYPAMIRPALAAAVDAGLPDAQTMWDKLTQYGGDIDYTTSNENNIVPRAA